jgi:hypothetical protein
VAHTLLLHTKRMLPEYISTIMWPFTLKCAEDRLNILYIALMVKRLIKQLLVLIQPRLRCWTSILSDARATFWIIDFSQEPK